MHYVIWRSSSGLPKGPAHGQKGIDPSPHSPGTRRCLLARSPRASLQGIRGVLVAILVLRLVLAQTLCPCGF